MQPPSPFPYSGGSRMEQALVPALQGANSNSMLGYVLGAQLQRQADQMGYEREMDDYNLTTQQEAQRVQEQAAADRTAQRNNALTAAAVNSGGPGFLPADYQLTDAQRTLANNDAAARIALRTAQAERAGRTGTGTGTTRPDPVAMLDLRGAYAEARQAQTRLDGLPAARQRALAGVSSLLPSAQPGAIARINEDFEKQQTNLTARLEALRGRTAQGLRPGTAQAPQATPQAAPAAPPAGGGEVAPQAAAPTPAPRTGPPEGARGRMPDGRMGTIVNGLFVPDPQR